MTPLEMAEEALYHAIDCSLHGTRPNMTTLADAHAAVSAAREGEGWLLLAEAPDFIEDGYLGRWLGDQWYRHSAGYCSKGWAEDRGYTHFHMPPKYKYPPPPPREVKP